MKLLMMKMIMMREKKCITRSSDSDTVYGGIVPQHSVYSTMANKKREPARIKSIILIGLYLCNYSSNFKI
jgi:hypothetical protein